MPPNGRVIVGCTHGEEDPDPDPWPPRTSLPAPPLDQGKPVVTWLTSEGVRLALLGDVDPIRA
jgi:uncharacterized protein